MTEQRTAEQLAGLLTAGAGVDGPRAAAVHLLQFTDVLGRPELARFLQIDGDRAYITEEGWEQLPDVAFSPPIASSTVRLLRLASSLAIGAPVDIREATHALGHAHARRVAEAVLMACGALRYYDLVQTAEAQRLQDLRGVLAGD